MNNGYLKVEKSQPLYGHVTVSGAKNAVLVMIASVLLTRGKSILKNVPRVADVYGMCELLKSLGATIYFDEASHILEIDTSHINANKISELLMKKMRTSVLVMGPLLATYGSVIVCGMPGGDAIGARPIDYHLNNFIKMGAVISQDGDAIIAKAEKIQATRIILEYPSVGATENILMLATKTPGITSIINAALEPEVCDLITVLKKMGAKIEIQAPATIIIEGVSALTPIEHAVMPDRLEVGSLLIAAAATKGEIFISNARAAHLDIFLYKLQEMGHGITIDNDAIHFKAHALPQAISLKTGPYPSFPTDLQAPMMALQTKAAGKCTIEETVFENRFLHIAELQKMGASIVINHNKAHVIGTDNLQGNHVIASDIRACMALVIAGLMAQGTTIISDISHWKRGYDALEKKLSQLGAKIELCEESDYASFLRTEKKSEKTV